MKYKIILVVGSLFLVMLISSALWNTSVAQSSVDSNLAMNNPDKFAWDLFAELNRPALIGKRGIPDPKKGPGDSGARIWETWKLTTPTGSEVFLENGQRPALWDQPDAQSLLAKPKKFLSPPKFTLQKISLLGITDPHQSRLLMNQTRPLFQGEESRMNRSGFEFIVDQGLYSIDGQERFRATKKLLQFPTDAIAVKASWRQLSADEIKSGAASRFYTYDQGNGVVLGLTGFHMSSKATPNWIWATFEQVDNPTPEIPDRDRYTKLRYPNSQSSSEARLRIVPEVLKNTVWQYYVLRGTQVDYTDAVGNPIILGNTQLESGMQTTASCMTCHARATIGDRVDDIVVNNRQLYPPGTFFYPGGLVSSDIFPDGTVSPHGANRLTIDPSVTIWPVDPQKPDNGSVLLTASANGVPDPNLFIQAGTGKTRYTQLDFMWEFMFAHREK